MSLLTGLFNNPVIKNAAFGQLKSIIIDEKLHAIIVQVDPENNDLIIKLCKAEDVTIIYNEKPEENADTQDTGQ